MIELRRALVLRWFDRMIFRIFVGNVDVFFFVGREEDVGSYFGIMRGVSFRMM